MDAARTWLPRGLGLAVFVLFAAASPPGLYWLDSPELSAAALRLGAPHPTGFPLYCILVKLASLIPFGELSWRVSLLSAACAGLTVFLACRLVIEAGRGDIAALVGAVVTASALTFSTTFFRQGTVPEIYVPTAALIALTLLLYYRVARGGGPRVGLALAVVAGLGLGVHSSYRLLMAVPIMILLVVRLRRGARWPLLAPFLVALIAVALHLYPPVRSATQRIDAVDWNHPSTANALYDYVTAKRIRVSFEDEIMSSVPEVVGENANRFLAMTADDLGPAALVLAFAGLVWLGRRKHDRWLLAAVATIIVGDFVYSIWINPMGIADRQNGIPLALAVCIAAGLGAAWFARFAGRGAPYVGALVVVMVAVPPAISSWSEVSNAAHDLPRRWSERALDQIPPRGIALVQSDTTASSMLYLTAAEGMRPDVTVLVRQHLLDLRRTSRMLERGGLDIELDESRPVASVLAAGRPVLWELGNDGHPPLTVGLPLAAIGPPTIDSANPHADLDNALVDLRALFGEQPSGDPIADALHAHSLTTLARIAYGRSMLDWSAALLDAALEFAPRHIEALVNRGVVHARSNNYQLAVEVTERALAIEPNREKALTNAARYWMAIGDDDAARIHAERATRVAPANAAGWSIAGILDARSGNFERARQRLERALSIDPRDADALSALRNLDAM